MTEIAEIAALEMCMGDMHCIRVCKENAALLKTAHAADHRKIRSKFLDRATREQIREFSDGSMKRIWRHI